MRKMQIISGLCSLLAGLGMSTNAAEIIWDPAVYITTNSASAGLDISTKGYYLVEAFNAGHIGVGDVTANGALFKGSSDLLPLNADADLWTKTTGDADYDSLLSSVDFGDAGTTTILSLGNGNLVPNNMYEVQVWYADTRNGKLGRTVQFSDGLGFSEVSLVATGQYAIGTFTADGAAQDLYISGSNGPHLLAYQLRSLSEGTVFTVDPAEVGLVLASPDTVITGSVDVAFSGVATSVDVSISIGGIGASAFTLLTQPSFTLTAPSPSSSTVQVVFDNSTAGLVSGESATGLVNMVFNETGSSDYTTNTVPMSVLYVNDDSASIFYQTASHNNANDFNGAWWTNATYTTPQMASSGNTYINTIGISRAKTSLFNGDSLEIRAAGGALGLKKNPVEVNLIMNAGTFVYNWGGGNNLNGTFNTETNLGEGSITFSSGADNRSINLNSSMSIGSNITSMVVDMGNYAGSLYDETLSINSTSNIFSGVWNVVSGYLVGNADSSLGAASFSVQANGTLDFNYAYSNVTQTLSVESGGLFMLDQDVVIGAVTLWGETLAEGVYSCANLKANGIYGGAIHTNSLDSATLFVGGYVAPVKEIGSIQINTSGGDLVIGVSNTVDSANYTVWVKSDLVHGTWSDLVVVPGSNGMMSIALPTADPEAFYRISGE